MNRHERLKWTRTLLVGIILLLTACGAGGDTSSEATPAQEATSTAASYETLVEGSILGTEPSEAMAILVTEEKDMDKLADVFPGGALPAELDSASLDDKAVLAIFGGTQSSSGYSVELLDTKVARDELLLSVSLTGPEPGQMVEPATQVPYTVLAVDRSALPADVEQVAVVLREEATMDTPSAAPTETEVEKPPATAVEYELLDSGSLLGGTKSLEPFAVVVTQESELEQIYEAFPRRSAAPTIDPAQLTEEKAIIAIFGGVLGSGGYTITLKDIKSEENRVVLDAAISGPAAGQMVEPAEQTPYSIVLVSRSRLPTEIEDVVLEVSKD
jgi:hypothetical protein